MKMTMRMAALLAVATSALLLTACKDEAPAAASAAVDAAFVYPAECATCHGDDPEFAVKGAQAAYAKSGHALGFESEEANASYSNGGGCQKCHTHEGFVNFVKTGDDGSESFIEWPSQPGCFTCHKPHETGDFELRVTAAVTLANGAVFDKGPANLCVTCHQSRRDVTTTAVETKAGDVSGHFGPHHGPQGDIFTGTGAYEFAGKTYSSSAHKLEIENACIDCHMALPDGRYGQNASIGGHSFGMGADVHGREKINLAACSSCHEDIKMSKDGYYDYMAGGDYDGDGTVEYAQVEVLGLLDRLNNDKGTGLLQKLSTPFYKADGSWNGVAKDSPVVRSAAEVGALYNYKLFGEEDRSMGMHNPTYVVQALMDTIASLDPTFSTANRPK